MKMKMKMKRIVCILLVLCLCLPLLSSGALAADGDVTVDAVNFPDEVFRTYVSENLDTNTDGVLNTDESAAVTRLELSSMGISSLKGVEYFTQLTWLDCSKNQLTELDIHTNTALKTLNCKHNQLMVLDVSKNTALKTLNCEHNQLMVLDVSKNTALEGLFFSYNQLTELDVHANTALVYLQGDLNQLTELDVSANTELDWFRVGGNKLTELDLSQNTKITSGTDGIHYNEILITKVSDSEYTADIGALVSDPTKVTLAEENTTAGTYDSKTGIATFSAQPGRISYNYDTGNEVLSSILVRLTPKTPTATMT